MYCRKCGAAIGDDDLFCTDCGADTGVKSDQNQNQDEKVEDSSTASSSSADAAPTDTVAAAEPAAYTGQASQTIRTAIKPGAERICGIVLIIAVFLFMLPTISNSLFPNFLNEIPRYGLLGYVISAVNGIIAALYFLAPIVMVSALAHTGIYGKLLFKSCSLTVLKKKRLISLALPDTIAGAAFGLFFLLSLIALSSETTGIISACISFIPYLLLAGAAVPYFIASRTAKSVKGIPSTPFMTSAIILCALGLFGALAIISSLFVYGEGFYVYHVWEVDIFLELYYVFIGYAPVSSVWLLLCVIIGGLATIAFFIIRGIFWFGAARRLAGAGYTVKKKVPVQNTLVPNVQAATSSNPHGYTGAPIPLNGGYGAPAGVAELTGGSKFGYFALGFFLGIIGVLIAWQTNKGTPIEKPAIRISIIGWVVSAALLCTCSCIIFVLPFALGAFM